ncbi:MAG: hypothetical protein IKM95_02430 [Bacteroidales bacterium]|jgi:hypothetical protein|nr:hypothetical protein [Bacteroidales bacterium]
MKRLTAILLLFCLWTLSPLPAQEAEDNSLELNLNTLLSDLNQISSKLMTYDDIAIYDYAYQEAGNRLRSFAALVSKGTPPYDIYSDCNYLFYQLQKRIEDLQDDHNHKRDYDALMNHLQDAIAELSTLQADGEHYVEANEQDSLLIVKKKASRVYGKTIGETETQQQLIDNDPAMQQLIESIEAYNEQIESMECRNKGQLYELLFRVVMVASMLILLVNMLKSKIKAKKMAKETQKQMNQLMMGGDDTPTL